MFGRAERGAEHGGQIAKIRTAIHNIRAPVTEFPEPRRNVGSCSLEFSRGWVLPCLYRYVTN